MNYSPDGANAFAYISKVDFGNGFDSIFTRGLVDCCQSYKTGKKIIEKSLGLNIGA